MMTSTTPTNSHCLSFLHLNMGSLTHNLTNLLANIDNRFYVVRISETWLSNSQHTCDIDCAQSS
jgi:hypothetical protein